MHPNTMRVARCAPSHGLGLATRRCSAICVQTLACVAVLGTASAAFGQSVVGTEHLQLLVGSVCSGGSGCERLPTGAEGDAPSFYGTDLGFSYVHDGQLRWVFGDTWYLREQMCWDSAWTNDVHDDVLGWIDLASRPDGDSVEMLGAPPLIMNRDPAYPNGPPGITLVKANGQVVSGRPGQTPAAAFSTGTDPWMVFRGEAAACRFDFQCPGDASCLVNNIWWSLPCWGQSDCVCVDKDSPNYGSGSFAGAVLFNMELGVPDGSSPEHHAVVHTWPTSRFSAPVIRTVRGFDPTAKQVADPRPAEGVVTGSEKLFVWGRPGFGGAQFWNRDAKLYLAYVELSSLSPAETAHFQPKFFAGKNLRGVPQWSYDEADAKPLNLSGGLFDPTEEALDVTNWNSISWVEPLQRWVMLYGGDLPDFVLLLTGGNRAVTPDGIGIYARFAEQPWGPWSPPQLVVKQAELYGPDSAYGSEALLWSDTSTGIETDPYRWKFLVGDNTDTCYQPNASQWLAGDLCEEPCMRCQEPCGLLGQPADPGKLYAPNIIEQWTEARPNGEADIYWNVSTWNPYQVQLLRTRLRAPW